MNSAAKLRVFMADLHVSVVYAEPGRQFVRELDIAPGSTVADAIRLSAIGELANLSEADLTRAGIFGRPVAASATLRDGDRVEIYRPLKIDPKEARRRRAEIKR
jgi:putative ubiquitin-RnfH superfamily antitoxin RatB of RatAB toxin-antitoxin module